MYVCGHRLAIAASQCIRPQVVSEYPLLRVRLGSPRHPGSSWDKSRGCFSITVTSLPNRRYILREFKADVTSADDNQIAGKLFQFEKRCACQECDTLKCREGRNRRSNHLR